MLNSLRSSTNNFHIMLRQDLLNGVRKFLIATIILLIFATYHPASAQEDRCQLGTYKDQVISGLNQDHRCIECPEGTFMPQENHQHTKCFDCTKIEDPTLEVLISPCTKSRDADIQCVDGYYRVLARNPRSKPECKECDPCHELLHEIRRCQNYSNTWCCPDVNYDFKYDKHGTALCRERPWMCRKGQYMDTSLNDCKPCPDGTFMSVDYHSYTECWNCQYHSDADLPLHTELIQPCNSTHPAIYSCKEGYYTNHSLSYRGDDIGCMPCTSCSDEMFVGRQCDKFHDTVCCRRPGMQVVDGPGGAHCFDDEDKRISTTDKPYSKGKLSTINMTIEKKINDAASDDDDDCEDGLVFLLAVLLVISFLVNALMVLKCILLPQRKYLSSKAKKLGTKLKVCTSPHADHDTVSRCRKSVSGGTAVQESNIDLHVEKESLQNNENEALVEQCERNVLFALVGKTGNGKSTTGNTILGKSQFVSSDSISSVTTSTNIGNSEFRDTAFKVVDIPDVGRGQYEIKKLKDHLISLIHENPQHIIAVTMIFKYGGRFTEDDIEILEMLRSTFGKYFIKRHVVVIMTFGDMFEKNKEEETRTFQDWCAEQTGPFAKLISECEQRVILFDNTVREGRQEYIQKLLEKTNNITGQGSHIRRRFFSKDREIQSHVIQADVIRNKNIDYSVERE